MTEKDGSTLTPEARDDALFALQWSFESMSNIRNRSVIGEDPDLADAVDAVRRQIAGVRSMVSEVAFVPICDLYELARIPGLLNRADSDFDACAMDQVDAETGENHRDNGFANLGEAVTVLTSHLPLQGMLDHEESAPTDTQLPRIEDIEGRSDSLVALARKEKAAEAEREAARKRATERRFKDAQWRIREVVRTTLPEGWVEEMEAKGVRVLPHFDPAQSWETILRALQNPSQLTFPIKADLGGPKGDIVRVTIERSKDGGFAVSFIPRALRLDRDPGENRLPYGWREDVEGHPRGKDADRPALARMLYDTLGLREE